MSKDFMTPVEMDIADKMEALHAFCRSQSVFYPPHPDYVVDGICSAFEDYWNGELDVGQDMADRCYLREASGLLKYFGQFLMEEDDVL